MEVIEKFLSNMLRKVTIVGLAILIELAND